jgi:hypothetical protein
MKARQAVEYFQEREFQVEIKLGSEKAKTRLKYGKGQNAILEWKGHDLLMGYLAYCIEANIIEIVNYEEKI